MKGLTLMVLATTMLAGCYFPGSCPDVEELPEYPVASGTYLPDDNQLETRDPDVFTSGSDHELIIDRDDGTATLSFTTADGRAVRLVYTVTEESWAFPPGG